MGIYGKLLGIQLELNAPKNQFNKFGGYSYRSCEDILEALKPLCAKYGACLVLRDDVIQEGDRFYVKATATLTDADDDKSSVTTYALAREEEAKKGMDSAQLTGATSSYARKYALNALFSIDDAKDADAQAPQEPKPAPKKPAPKKPAEKPAESAETVYCRNCGKAIQTVTVDGKSVTWKKIAAVSKERFGAPYCFDCYASRKKKEDANREGGADVA